MKSRSRKRVYYCGNKWPMRSALEAALKADGTLLTCYARQKDCLEKLSSRPCDLLIVDLEGWEAEGLRLLVDARRMAPWVSVLAVVERANVPCAVKAVRAGASECLEKPIPLDRLLEAVQGQLIQIAASTRSRRTLTEMEIQILQLILAGKTSQGIAGCLRRSKRTIDVHRKNIMRKLQADNLVDLIKRALAMGLTEEPASDAPGPDEIAP